MIIPEPRVTGFASTTATGSSHDTGEATSDTATSSIPTIPAPCSSNAEKPAPSACSSASCHLPPEPTSTTRSLPNDASIPSITCARSSR